MNVITSVLTNMRDLIFSELEREAIYAERERVFCHRFKNTNNPLWLEKSEHAHDKMWEHRANVTHLRSALISLLQVYGLEPKDIDTQCPERMDFSKSKE